MKRDAPVAQWPFDEACAHVLRRRPRRPSTVAVRLARWERRDVTRYHSLDALRAFALLLGVVFHAAESFMAGHYEWAAVDSSPSTALRVFRYACHSFRLEVFYLIAGFFACLVCTRRGLREFVRNRFGRIFVPLVVGWLILYPLLVLIWLWGASNSGHWDRVRIPEELRDLAPWRLTIGFFASRGYIENFDLTHLWFLHQLLVLYALFLPGRAVFIRLLDARGIWRQRIYSVYRRALESRWQVVFLAGPAIPFLLMMDSWQVDTPQRSLLPDLSTTLLYGYCFTLGWLLYRQLDLLASLARRWHVNLALGILLVLPSCVWLDYLLELPVRPQWWFWARVGHSALYALMMWALVLGVSGVFARYRQTESAVWRYIADSSYWIYLVHIPVVVTLQVLIAPIALPWPPKFLAINLIAFPVLFLSYHFLVRSTPIGVQLNGRRYPFVPPHAVWSNARSGR